VPRWTEEEFEAIRPALHLIWREEKREDVGIEFEEQLHELAEIICK